MKDPKRIHLKRLKRKRISQRRIAWLRDQRMLARLPKKERHRILLERIQKKRALQEAKKAKAKKREEIFNLFKR